MWLLSIDTKVTPSDISCDALRGDDSQQVYLKKNNFKNNSDKKHQKRTKK